MESPTTTIDAIYSGGVLRPLGEVQLEENQHVRLTIQPAQPLPPAVAEWLAEAAALRLELFDQYGYYDDSTEIIASDRRRDG